MAFFSKCVNNKLSTNLQTTNQSKIWSKLFAYNQFNLSFSFENDADFVTTKKTRSQDDFGSKFNNQTKFMRDNSSFRKSSFSKQNISWQSENLVPLKKNFYQEHPDVKKMTPEEIHKIRQESEMLIFGKDVPKPFRFFHESGVPEDWLKHLNGLDISTPTPIQQQGIPMALSGRDVVGISRTGSGKTLAYLLPCVVHISAQESVKRGEGPIALILAPTRELADQIGQEIEKLIQSNRSMGIKYCTVYGGTDRHRQISKLQNSPDILVATPGRLMDLLQEGQTNFKRTTYCVLDEADRMLDMGFRDDIETILSYIRPDKQMLMWSATWPKEIQSISLKYMNDPIRVQIGSAELVANSNIKQYFRFIEDQYSKLETIVKDCEELISQNKKILIFTNQKKTSSNLAFALQKRISKLRSSQIEAIHGDKSQPAREYALKHFRSSNGIRILIATDVVARGIDISDIDCVLVYDFPMDIETYVHRIGRTARGHNEGMSLSYMSRQDISRLGNDLTQVLQKANQRIPKWLQSKFY